MSTPALITTPLTDQYGQHLIWPYIDMTGRLIVIPVIQSTGGVPDLPRSVVAPPTFKKNGAVLTGADAPILLVPADGTNFTYAETDYLYFVLYQMPFGAPLLATDVLTMSAAPGWATVDSGPVGGTSIDGTSDAELVVNNFVGMRERPIGRLANVPQMKLGVNSPSFCEAPRLAVGHVAANWAKRLQGIDKNAAAMGIPSPWIYNGNTDVIYENDASGVPTTFDGSPRCFFYYLTSDSMGNARGGSPLNQNGQVGAADPTNVTWTLVYDDATASPDLANGPVADLTISTSQPSRQVAPVSSTAEDGTYDASASPPIRRDIKRTFTFNQMASGGYWPASFCVQMGSGATNADGHQIVAVSNIRAYPPGTSPPEPLSSASPYDLDPIWLQYASGRYCVRFVDSALGAEVIGRSNLVTIDDLDLIKTTDECWATTKTTISHVVSIGPMDLPVSFLVDFLGTPGAPATVTYADETQFMTVWENGMTAFLVTTDAPHGIRTGQWITITVPSKSRAYMACDYNRTKLLSSIAATGGPATFSLEDGTGLAAGSLVEIGTEVLTVESTTRTDQPPVTVTATRGTSPSAHSIGDLVYFNRAWLASDLGAADTTWELKGGPGGSPIVNTKNYVQIDDERIYVVTTVTDGVPSYVLTRGADQTTAAAHSAGALVMPCVTAKLDSQVFVVDETHFVFTQVSFSGLNMNSLTHLVTRAYETITSFGAGGAPVVEVSVPKRPGFMGADVCASAVSTVIDGRDDKEGVLWLSTSPMMTDDAVKACVASMVPYLGAGVKLIIEYGNECWNAHDNFPLFGGLLGMVVPADFPGATTTYCEDWRTFATYQQHRRIVLAQEAFTEAGLDPGRVLNGYGVQMNNGNGVEAVASLCQKAGWPIDYIWAAPYQDNPLDEQVLQYWSDHVAAGDMDMDAMRRIILSVTRVQSYFARFPGAANLYYMFQPLFRYNSGQNADGSSGGSPAANTGLGRYCFYEAQLSTYLPKNWLVDPAFAGLQRDVLYHPDSYATFTAFLDALQRSPVVFASLDAGALQGSALWSPDFGNIFTMCQPSLGIATTTLSGASGYYDSEFGATAWWGQPPGDGQNNQFGWDPATAADSPSTLRSYALTNSSVTLKAQNDWNAAVGAASVPLARAAYRGQRVFNTSGTVFNAPSPTWAVPPPPSYKAMRKRWTPSLGRSSKKSQGRSVR